MPGSGGTRDLAWFAPGGGLITNEEWFDTGLQTIGMYLDGRGIRHRDQRGRPVVDDSWLVWLHAGPEDVEVTLPGAPWADGYDSRSPRSGPPARGPPHRRRPGPLVMPSRTVWALRVLRRP